MKRAIYLLLSALPLSTACNEHSLGLCDITQSGCQEDIYYADLHVRGDGYDPFGGMPPIRTITEADFREELQAQVNQPVKSDPQPWWDAALKMLHFVPETDLTDTSIDDQVTNVAAYYSNETKSVTVVAHPVDPSTVGDANAELNRKVSDMSTLAHELIHALQDRQLNLGQDAQGGTDGDFANTALIEGDASLYEELFRREIGGLRLRDADSSAYFARYRQAMLDEFDTLGAPYFAAHWLVYPLGGAWLADKWKSGGNAAVRHAYANAPKRSLDYLLGPGAAAPPEAPIDCFPTSPGAVFLRSDGRPYGMDSLGAMEFYAFLSAWKVSSADLMTAATQWRNDFMFVYYNQTTKKTAVAWHIELGSPLAASVLAAITTTDGPRVVATGNSLMITASDDAALMAAWNPTASCP